MAAAAALTGVLLVVSHLLYYGAAEPRLRSDRLAALAAPALALLVWTVPYMAPSGLRLLVFNLVLLALIVGVVAHGTATGRPGMVNSALAAFIVALVTRYFDAFWALLDRSIFFMGGGALLLTAGVWLERRRRHLLERMKEADTHAPTP